MDPYLQIEFLLKSQDLTSSCYLEWLLNQFFFIELLHQSFPYIIQSKICPLSILSFIDKKKSNHIHFQIDVALDEVNFSLDARSII